MRPTCVMIAPLRPEKQPTAIQATRDLFFMALRSGEELPRRVGYTFEWPRETRLSVTSRMDLEWIRYGSA